MPYIFVFGNKNKRAEVISPIPIIIRQFAKCIGPICSGWKNNFPDEVKAYSAVSNPAITHAVIFLVFEISVDAMFFLIKVNNA